MMETKIIPKHGEYRQDPLAKILATGQISHAYLLLGEKEFVIAKGLWFARALNCEQLESDTHGPCEQCASCRKALHGNHSGIHHVIAAGGRQTISIEQVRHLQQEAYLTHLEGQYAVFLIAAEEMREEAANSLLKVLEEPPSHTVFILYAEKALDLLPTILSRCQIIRLQEGEGGALAQDLLAKAWQWLEDLPQMSPERLLSWGDRWDKDKQGLRQFLLGMLECLHQTILDYVAKNPEQATREMLLPWLEGAALVEETVESLDRNMNQRLLIDVLVLKLKKLLG